MAVVMGRAVRVAVRIVCQGAFALLVLDSHLVAQHLFGCALSKYLFSRSDPTCLQVGQRRTKAGDWLLHDERVVDFRYCTWANA